jgi:hypothetical protein
MDPAVEDKAGTSAIDHYQVVNEAVAFLPNAREAYLQQIRDSNRAKNKSFMMAIVGRSGFLPTVEQATEQAAIQARNGQVGEA